MEELGFSDPSSPAHRIQMYIGLVGFAAGVWWIVLSGLFAVLFAPIRTLFAPVLDWMDRGDLAVLASIGAVVASIGGTLLWVV